MSEAVIALPSADDLTAYVHKTLCDRDALDPGQTPLVKTPLTRNRRACGILFHVEGPRLLRTSAVWAADENRLIFYDSSGLRGAEVRLSESPDMTELDRRKAA